MGSYILIGNGNTYKINCDMVVDEKDKPKEYPLFSEESILLFISSPPHQFEKDYDYLILRRGKLFGSYKDEEKDKNFDENERLLFENITEIIDGTTHTHKVEWMKKYCIHS